MKKSNSFLKIQSNRNEVKNTIKLVFLTALMSLSFKQKSSAFEYFTRTPLNNKGSYDKVDYRLKCSMAGYYTGDPASIDRLGTVEFRFQSINGSFWAPKGVDVNGAIVYNINNENGYSLKHSEQTITVTDPRGGQFNLPQKIYFENSKGDRTEFNLESNEVTRTYLKIPNGNYNVGYDSADMRGKTLRVVERPEFKVELIECDLNNIDPDQI